MFNGYWFCFLSFYVLVDPSIWLFIYLFDFFSTNPFGTDIFAPSKMACDNWKSNASAAIVAARNASQISLRPSNAGAVSQNSSRFDRNWPSVSGTSDFQRIVSWHSGWFLRGGPPLPPIKLPKTEFITNWIFIMVVVVQTNPVYILYIYFYIEYIIVRVHTYRQTDNIHMHMLSLLSEKWWLTAEKQFVELLIPFDFISKWFDLNFKEKWKYVFICSLIHSRISIRLITEIGGVLLILSRFVLHLHMHAMAIWNVMNAKWKRKGKKTEIGMTSKSRKKQQIECGKRERTRTQ